MSTNVPNLKQIGRGHRKNGQKFVDLMWNDPITCRTFTLNMIHVLKFVSFSNIMYLVLRHVGGSRDSGTGCALVGVSRYNFTNVYFCIMFYIE